MVALYSHIFLCNYVFNMLFLFSALQLASHCLTQSISKTTLERGTTLSVTFIPLSSCFSLSATRHVLLLPAFSSSVVLPRSPTHHLLSPSLNDLIPPMPLHLNTHVWSNFSVEVTPQGLDVTALILHGVNMSWLSALLCDSGKLAIFWMFKSRETTLIWVVMRSNEFHFIETAVRNLFRPSSKFQQGTLTSDFLLHCNTAYQEVGNIITSLWGFRDVHPSSTTSVVLQDILRQWYTHTVISSHWKAVLGQPAVTPWHVGVSGELMSFNGFSQVLLSTENESHSVSGNGGKRNLWGLLFWFMHSCGLGLTESLFGVRALGKGRDTVS